MRAKDITVEVRDKTFARKGIIRQEDLDLLLQVNYNNVGTWTIKLPVDHPMVPELKTPGSGIIVTGPGWVSSGPTDGLDQVASVDDPEGTITFKGVTDDHILADRLAYPDPTTDDVTDQDETPVAAKPASLMAYYVMANAGEDAVASRKIDGLVLPSSYPAASIWSLGTTRTKVARFQRLGSLLTEIADRAKNVGFRIVQRGSELHFECYQVANRTGDIRLDVWNQTLSSHRTVIAPPTVTRAIVAGNNEDGIRTLKEVSTDDSEDGEDLWGRRIERLIDARSTSRTSDIDEDLESSGEEALAVDGVPTVSVQAIPTAESSMQFGVDFNVGDKVTVVVDGVELSETVSGMIVRSNPREFSVGALIGDPTKFDANKGLAKQVAISAARLDKIEKVGTTTPIYTGDGGGGGSWSGMGGSGTITSPQFDDVAVVGATYTTAVVDNAIGTVATSGGAPAPFYVNPGGGGVGIPDLRHKSANASGGFSVTTAAGWVAPTGALPTCRATFVWPASNLITVHLDTGVSPSGAGTASIGFRVLDSTGTTVLYSATGSFAARHVYFASGVTAAPLHMTATTIPAVTTSSLIPGTTYVIEPLYRALTSTMSFNDTNMTVIPSP